MWDCIRFSRPHPFLGIAQGISIPLTLTTEGTDGRSCADALGRWELTTCAAQMTSVCHHFSRRTLFMCLIVGIDDKHCADDMTDGCQFLVTSSKCPTEAWSLVSHVALRKIMAYTATGQGWSCSCSASVRTSVNTIEVISCRFSRSCCLFVLTFPSDCQAMES